MRKYVPLIFLLLVACSEDTITTSFGDPELERRAIPALEKAGLWYRQKSDGRFEFKNKDVRAVEALIGSVAQQVLPFDRSVSYGPEMEEIMVRLLKKNGVPYTVTVFQGTRWFVWEEQNAADFRRVQDAATAELESQLSAPNGVGYQALNKRSQPMPLRGPAAD